MHNYPYGSDNPAAVRGPWRAVLVGDDGLTVGFDRWITGTQAWAYDSGPLTVAVVRGPASPIGTDDNGVGRMPTPEETFYRPDDVLYRYENLTGEDAVTRWAQARMVAALMQDNEDRIAELAERLHV